MYLYAPGMTCFLEPFPYAMDVGYHKSDVLVVAAVVVVDGCGVVVVIGILVLVPVEFML